MTVDDEQGSTPQSADELIRMIGALALDIHMKQSEEVRSILPISSEVSLPHVETADYQIDSNTIRFSSLEARNRVVAAYTFSEKREAIADDGQGWLWVAHELLLNETNHSDSAAGRLLALVHETR